MCCTNVSSLCKWFILFVSVLAGVALAVLLGIFAAASIPVVLYILLGLSVLLLAGATLVAIYATTRGVCSIVEKCFCEIGAFFLIFAVISVLAALLALAFVGTVFLVVAIGFVMGFFTAALLALICFLLCLVRNRCCPE